jgi:hypothetical protein
LAGTFTPFLLQDALQAVVAHTPAGQLQQRGDAPVAILVGRCNDRLRQPIFVLATSRLITCVPRG